MEAIATSWTFREFKAYLFLYAANSKYFETEEEKRMVHNIIDSERYRKIHREFEMDNDYQSIQKILYHVESLGLNQKDLDILLREIRELFDSNRKHDLLEENMFLALKHLLQR
ncbi:MAG: hypothetical protein ACO1O6_07945 [Bacteroidota bacterium]